MDFRDAPTQWSLIDELRQEDGAELAWNQLYFTYREPIVGFVLRRYPQKCGRPVGRGEAEELAQSFVSDCFAGRWLDSADPEKGSFRSLFCTILDRYLAKQARAQARHTGPGRANVSLQSPLEDGEGDWQPPAPDSVRVHFERQWVRVQLAQALARLRERQPTLYEVLKDTLEDIADEDIAKRRRISRENVRARRKRARDAIIGYYQDITSSTAANAQAFDEELLYIEELLNEELERDGELAG